MPLFSIFLGCNEQNFNNNWNKLKKFEYYLDEEYEEPEEYDCLRDLFLDSGDVLERIHGSAHSSPLPPVDLDSAYRLGLVGGGL